MDRELALEIADDAYDYFMNGYDIKDLTFGNLYKNTLTNDRSIDDEIYQLASGTLLDFEYAPREEAIEALADELEEIDLDNTIEESKNMRITKRQLKSIIREVIEESSLNSEKKPSKAFIDKLKETASLVKKITKDFSGRSQEKDYIKLGKLLSELDDLFAKENRGRIPTISMINAYLDNYGDLDMNTAKLNVLLEGDKYKKKL